MALNIKGDNGLYFQSGIDLQQFDKDLDKMTAELYKFKEQAANIAKELQLNPNIDTSRVKNQIREIEVGLSKLTAEGLNTGPVYQSINAIQAKLVSLSNIPINPKVDPTAANQTIETLRAKVLAKKELIVTEKDIAKVATYNKEIDKLETEIGKITNAGRKGFDDLGNKVVDTAKKGGLLQKSFSFLKQAALFIPGIGIAGLIGLLSDGVISLVASLFKGEKALSAFKSRYNDLAAAINSSGFKDAVKNVDELKISIDQAKKGFGDKDAVLGKYNNTLGSTIGYAKNLEQAEKNLADNADAYIKMTLLKAAANVALEEAAKKAVEAEKVRLQKVEEFSNAITDTRINVGGSGGLGTGQFNAKDYEKETERIRQAQEKRKQQRIKIEEDAANQQRNIAKKFLEDAAKIQNQVDNKTSIRSVTVIDKEIAGLKQQQQQVSSNSKTWDEYTKKIKALEKEREAITGKPKSEIKAQQKDLDKRQKDLENLLRELENAEARAKRSGLTKDESELEKTKKFYDDLSRKAKELKASSSVLSRINNASTLEQTNLRLKQEADDYKNSIEQQKKLYDGFEQYKKQVGEENATVVYKVQIGQFQSYIDFLKSEFDKLKDNPNVFKKEFLTNEITKAEGELKNKRIDAQRETFDKLLNETVTFNDQRISINKKYDDLEAELARHSNLSNYLEKKSLLQQGRKEELEAVRINIIQQSELYKKLNVNAIDYSRDRIKALIKNIKDDLKKGFTIDAEGNKILLTPQMIEEAKSGIAQWESLLNSTNKVLGLTSRELSDIAGQAQSVAGIFSTLANSVEPLNANLADVFSQVSELATVAGSAFQGLSQLAEGDYFGAIQSAANIVGSIINVFAQAKKTASEAKKSIAEFYANIQAGAIETQMTIRAEMALEATRNKTRLEGLIAEEKQLRKNRQESKKQYDEIFAQIQKEQYIASEKAKKGRGSALFGLVGVLTGIGAKTKVQQELASLAGKSFQEIEDLFNKNQLTDKAKELFEQLKKLKEEGVDIDRQLEDIKNQTKQIFTGTTAESLTSSIAQMFKEGKTSAEDFARFFEETMQNAALSVFESKFIARSMEDFFKQFSELAESDGGLTKEEKDRLKQSFQESTEKLKQQFEQFKDITGGSSAVSSTNSLKGSIELITEQTAGVLAGHLSGLRLSQSNLVDIQKKALGNLKNIEANTANTVNRLEKVVDTLRYYFETVGVKLKG